MGQNLLFISDPHDLRPRVTDFLDATTRTLLFHLTILEYMDDIAVQRSFTPASWYVKPWHGPKRLGKPPRKLRGGWCKPEEGLRSFEGLETVLDQEPQFWRACLNRKHPKSQYADDTELQWLLADLRAFRKCLVGAVEAHGGFYLTVM